MRRFLTKAAEGKKDDPQEEITPSSAFNTRLSALLEDQSKHGKTLEDQSKQLDVGTINALTLTSVSKGSSSNKRKEATGIGSGSSSGDDTKITTWRGRSAKRPRSSNASKFIEADVRVECLERVDGDRSNTGSGVSGGTKAGKERASFAGAAGAASTTSAAKMGPWMSARWGRERAICAEEGYDPLMLVHDANGEIFGNESFRGVQEEASLIF